MTGADVAVVIPCWNHGVLLGDAIASCLTQTVRPGTIFVIDDGSSDNTAEVAARYPVRYVPQPERRGVAAAMNRGFELAGWDGLEIGGGYAPKWAIALAADDMLPVNYIAAHLSAAVFCSEPEKLALVYSKAVFVRRNGSAFGRFGGGPWVPGAIQRNNFVHGAAMVRLSAWDACGRFQEQGNEDWQLWKRMDAAGWIGVEADTCLYYRQHDLGHRNYGTDVHRDRDWQGRAVEVEVCNPIAPG